MKQVLNIILMVSLILGACSKGLSPQETAVLQKTVNERNFIFEVQSVNPMSGGNIQMTPGFDITVTPDAIDVALPYFGRAFTPPLPNQGGYRFISKQFQYHTSNNDGQQEIVIVPKDVTDVQQMRLSISSDGYATLHVTSTNRQPISYYGTISKTKAATKK